MSAPIPVFPDGKEEIGKLNVKLKRCIKEQNYGQFANEVYRNIKVCQLMSFLCLLFTCSFGW